MTEDKYQVISKELLDILACPVCKTTVELIKLGTAGNGLICKKCSRVYPVKDGIPIMLESEAIQNPQG